MARRQTFYLPVMIAATVAVACLVALLAASEEEAQAAFPGKNGRIAYNSGGIIYTIHPNGRGKTKVANTYVSGDPIEYSPGGKKITYMSYEGFNDGSPTGPQKDSEIYTIKVDGTGKFQLTNNNTNDFTPSYSPDGKKIVFSGEHRKQFPPWAYTADIYTIGVNGKNKVQLTNNSTYDTSPDYSPDGRRIAFAGLVERNQKIYTRNIYTISARGGGKIKVARGGDDPDYSPDGKKIVYFTGSQLQHPEVYTINVGGGDKFKVTEGFNPSWGSRR
jgi:Tol biopolymer transport system component